MKPTKKTNQITKLMIILIVLQVSLILVLILNRLLIYIKKIPSNNFNNSDFLLICIISIVSIFFYIMIMQAKEHSYEQIKSKFQQQTIESIQNLNIQMRSQRHDFLNHIQVIYSLLEMEEYEEARNYLNKVYGDLETINKIIRTSDVAINALLQAKYNVAIRKKISFNISITTNLNGLPVPSWEMCRILANLIDNAIYATEEFSSDKKIDIYIKESVTSYIFIIINTSNNIDQSKITKMYDVGFTTKGNDGEGMGLFISKEIVQNYNGTIECDSKNNITTFTIIIPKKLNDHILSVI